MRIMALHIQIIYETEKDWVDLYLSGGYVEEIRKTGYWMNKKVEEIKYPDGHIWLCLEHKWDEAAAKKVRERNGI